MLIILIESFVLWCGSNLGINKAAAKRRCVGPMGVGDDLRVGKGLEGLGNKIGRDADFFCVSIQGLLNLIYFGSFKESLEPV